MASEETTIRLENKTPNSNMNKDIGIKSVELNKTSTYVDITINGVADETYKIKAAENNSNTVFLEEQVTVRPRSTFQVKADLKKGHSYAFTLFDRHNTPLDVFSFDSPIDFNYVEPVEVVVEAQPTVEVIPLVKTSDTTAVYILPALMMFIILFAVMTLKYKKMKG